MAISLMRLCCTYKVYVISLLIITTLNGSPFPNELCFSSNWMSIAGASWSFDNKSCTVTNHMSDNNMAMLAYKSFPYLTEAQDPSYALQIEYNFTITAASANNTVGSVGVIWFPNAQTYDYMAVSFKQNEALAAYTTGIQKAFVYDNEYVSSDGGQIVTINKGALPFKLSLNTFYSMRIQISEISDRGPMHSIYLNNHLVLNKDRTYSTAFQHNISWIGLKSTDASVISHALSVHQTSNIDNGDSVVQYFRATTTAMPIYTAHTSTFVVFSTEMGGVESTESANSDSVSNISDSSIFGMNMTILWMILSICICCVLCCGVMIIVILCLPPKNKSVPHMLDMQSNERQYIQSQDGCDPAANENDDVFTVEGPDESNEYAFKRMVTPEGGQRAVMCDECNSAINNAQMYIKNGVVFCKDCHDMNSNETIGNDFDDIPHAQSVATKGFIDCE